LVACGVVRQALLPLAGAEATCGSSADRSDCPALHVLLPRSACLGRPLALGLSRDIQRQRVGEDVLADDPVEASLRDNVDPSAEQRAEIVLEPGSKRTRGAVREPACRGDRCRCRTGPRRASRWESLAGRQRGSADHGREVSRHDV
jgi:hypothetical protein